MINAQESVLSLIINIKREKDGDGEEACEYCGTRLSKNVPHLTHTVYNSKDKLSQRVQHVIQNCPQ